MRYITLIVFWISICSAYSQNLVSLEGRILLDEGSPAIGASIFIVGTTIGTAADIDGNFSLKNIPAGTHTIEVDYIGMKSFQEELDITKNISDYVVRMQTSSENLDEVIVTAKSASRNQKEQAIHIQSVEIKNVASRVKDLTEVVDQMSGVRVRTTGSMGDNADISLNGLNGNAVRTYIDGMPLEFVFPSGSLSNLPLSNVKRIDVYKGVVPVSIGTDAMGGGINVITEYKPFNSLKATYGYGSYNTHQAGISGNYVITPHLVVSSNVAYNSSDNDYKMKAFIWEDKEERKVSRFHDGYRMGYADAALVIKDLSWVDEARLRFSYADYYRELQHGGRVQRRAYGEALYDGNNKNAVFDFRKELLQGLHLENIATLGREEILFVDTTTRKYSWSGEVISRSRRGEFGAASEALRKRKIFVNRTNLRYDLSTNTSFVLSNIYANMDLSGRDSQLSEKKDLLTKPQILTKDVIGLEIKQHLFSRKLQLSAALKNYSFHLNTVDRRSVTPIEKRSATRGWYATGKYNITPDLFVRASFEKAWRIPTFVQFFGNGTNIVANANLKPESSDNYNIGLSYQTRQSENFGIRISANGFIRAQKEIIFLSGELRQRYINSESVDTKGIEAEAQFTLFEHLTLSLNATRLTKTYAYIDSTLKTSQFLVGTAFPNTPKLFGNARITFHTRDIFQQSDGIKIYTQYKYVDEFNFINISKKRNDDNWVPVQHRLDAGFTYSLKDNTYSISANVYNILGEELFDNYKIPRPGRNYNIKIIYQINNYN